MPRPQLRNISGHCLAEPMYKMYSLSMAEPTPISISDLRRTLHDVLGRAENGETLTVMHHQQAIAQLTAPHPNDNPPSTIGSAQLRTTIHQVLRDVQFKQTTYLILQHHRPVAQLSPAKPSVSKGEPMSASILALVSLKGGVGKTTSTMHLASVAAMAGHTWLQPSALCPIPSLPVMNEPSSPRPKHSARPDTSSSSTHHPTTGHCS